ncbi:MAG: esterase family protein [Propionibacteriaceae bacterium]|nr:esterase family protein [Propionibacteriaceae bacterium]
MSDYLPVFVSGEGERTVVEAYDAVLRSWSVPCYEVDVPTSFGLTHVIVSGPEDGPPVILMHAMFATATAWYGIVGPLSRQYRTLAVDILGEANKSRPSRPITSRNDYLQWFTELVDGLGLSQMTLVGNSLGGWGSAYIAMHLRNRVQRLVLISPAATFHSIVPFYLHFFLPKAAYLFFPWLPGVRPMMRRCVNWAWAGLPSDGAWNELFYLTMVHGSTQSRVFPRVFTEEQLARIEAPTLLLVGDHERIYPPDVVIEDAQRLMPSVEVGIIADAHHVAAVAQPNAVSARILAFLAKQGH